MSGFKLILKIGVWVFVAIAVADLTIALFLYRHTQTFIATASRAQGTITKVLESEGKDHYSSPVFTFTDSSGQKQEVYSSSGQYPPAYKVGEKVIVLYQPNDSKHAKLSGFFELWSWPVMLGGFGLISLISAVVSFVAIYLVGRHERKLPPRIS